MTSVRIVVNPGAALTIEEHIARAVAPAAVMMNDSQLRPVWTSTLLERLEELSPAARKLEGLGGHPLRCMLPGVETSSTNSTWSSLTTADYLVLAL